MSSSQPRARNGQRYHRPAIGQHDLAYFGRAALAGAEDVIDAAGLEFGDRLGTDHAAIGDHADVADTKAIAQPGDARQQGFDVAKHCKLPLNAKGLLAQSP